MCKCKLFHKVTYSELKLNVWSVCVHCESNLWLSAGVQLHMTLIWISYRTMNRQTSGEDDQLNTKDREGEDNWTSTCQAERAEVKISILNDSSCTFSFNSVNSITISFCENGVLNAVELNKFLFLKAPLTNSELIVLF